LLAAVPDVALGMLETFLTLREFAPSFPELLYRVNLHLLFALAAVLL